MPTYEYECERGHRFEVEQKITEEPVKECRAMMRTLSEPLCGARCKRLVGGGTGFQLRGSGWAKDNYR